MNFVPFGFISILFVVIGIALGFFSPKKKIWWYGYRTPQSMRSDASYIFANKLSGRILLAVGLIVFIGLFFLNSFQLRILTIIGVVVTLVITEWRLWLHHKQCH